MMETSRAPRDFEFGDPTIETDECIDVTDDQLSDPLGEVCAGDAPHTFNYTLDDRV